MLHSFSIVCFVDFEVCDLNHQEAEFPSRPFEFAVRNEVPTTWEARRTPILSAGENFQTSMFRGICSSAETRCKVGLQATAAFRAPDA